MIEERRRRLKEEINNNIYQKINNERMKYCQSLDKYLLKKKEEEVLQKERAFKKYENFVSIKFIILVILIIVFYDKRKEAKTKRKIKKNISKINRKTRKNRKY